jgi:hypothetical protein
VDVEAIVLAQGTPAVAEVVDVQVAEKHDHPFPHGLIRRGSQARARW